MSSVFYNKMRNPFKFKRHKTLSFDRVISDNTKTSVGLLICNFGKWWRHMKTKNILVVLLYPNLHRFPSFMHNECNVRQTSQTGCMGSYCRLLNFPWSGQQLRLQYVWFKCDVELENCAHACCCRQWWNFPGNFPTICPRYETSGIFGEWKIPAC